jgi:putative redox protein
MATQTTYYRGSMLFESELGSHTLKIDVPPAMGGSDRGPTPPELFIASLGSCVGAYVAQYCERTGLDTDGLTIDVSYEKVEDPTRLTNVKVQVNLPKADCERKRGAIERVAAHCPVHETIGTVEGITFEIADCNN